MSCWQPRKEFLKDNNLKLSIDAEPMPEDITLWLSKLHLLYGVPFQYLVPDERMLPNESLRFFHLDETWVNRLIDGAMSIGRVIFEDQKHDLGCVQNVQSQIKGSLPNIRRMALRKQPLKDTPPRDVSDIKTGFLLRSALVEGWPGLEVKAFKAIGGEDCLPILRMERLSDHVLLGIFDGEFQELEIREPAETMHFGADVDDGRYTKMLRGLGVNKVPLGVEMPDSIVAVPVDQTTRKLDVLKMVENIKTALANKGECGNYFSSAEFAVEMVESAEMGVFKNGE